MREHRGRRFLLLNALLSLILGAAVYCLLAPEVLFVRRLGLPQLFVPALSDIPILTMIRNFLPDLLWAYALVFALTFILGSTVSGIRTSLLIALIFSALLELLQLSGSLRGTFDVLDLTAEAAAELTAAGIIKFHMFKEEKNL